METSKIELVNFFENRDEMIQYCINLARTKSIKFNILNSGNYYKIQCKDQDCPFQITFNLRDSKKCKKGYYLVLKGTNLNHKINCSHSIQNIRDSLDPHALAERISDSFKESMPSINQVKNILKIISGKDFTKNESKYIRHLAKGIFFNHTKGSLGQLIDLAEKFKNEHNWELNYDFFEGTLTAIILFPPWARKVLKSYPNPLIVDATFSKEDIRFTTCAVIDGELHTQIVGIVLRGTEDSKGYRYIFDMIENELPDVHFTVISDMAPCIEKACRDSFGKKYNLIYCLFHLKENFLKKFQFKPSVNLWKCLKHLMQGKISDDTFQALWIKEESQVDSELKGLYYLSNIAHHFLSNPKIHKRNIVSSQRLEMFNNIIKLKSNNAYYMLQECFTISTEWFEASASRIHKENQLLTDSANQLIDKMILKDARNEFYDDEYHLVGQKGKCVCYIDTDLGIPCPKQIRFLRENNIDLYKAVSKDWLCSTFHEAFGTITCNVSLNNHSYEKVVQTDQLKVQDADLIASKIRYLYQNSPEYREKINDLIHQAQIDIQLPLFSLLNKPKKKQKKRYISSIEENNLDKDKSLIFKIIQRHVEGRKVTISALVSLANQLCDTNPAIPRLKYTVKTKKAIIDWYFKNWTMISKAFADIPNQAPNGVIVSDDENEIF